MQPVGDIPERNRHTEKQKEFVTGTASSPFRPSEASVMTVCGCVYTHALYLGKDQRIKPECLTI